MPPALPSRDRIRHPGPVQPERRTAAPVRAVPIAVAIEAGASLAASVGREMDRLGADSAVLILDGIRLAHCAYVMPASPPDSTRAAWYSTLHTARDVVLDSATATVGRKDGAWFLHCHALWNRGAPGQGMGHLMCAETMASAQCTVRGYALHGARLDVRHDPETNFALFHVAATGGDGGDGLLLTLKPHEDLRTSIEAAAQAAGLRDAAIIGIGSAIGAAFADGTTMAAPLSELVVLPGSAISAGRCTRLHVACVDPQGAVFSGDLVPGAAPVCVTAELLLIATNPERTSTREDHR